MSERGGEHTAHLESRPTPELDNHANALREQFVFDPDFVTEQRSRLWAVAERMASMVINPDQRDAIAIYAGIRDWNLFGASGDSLPPGLVINNSERTVRPDYDIPYVSSAGSLDETFNKIGFKEATDAVNQKLNERSATTENLIHDFITNTAEYQLLSSFDRPQRQDEEVSLNRYWKMVHETQIEHDVRNKHGYSPKEPLPPNGAADRELRRRLQRLDDETMRSRTKPKSHRDALQRARTYLTPYVAQAFDSHYYKNRHTNEQLTFKEVYYDEYDEELSVRTHEIEDDNQYVGDFHDITEIAAWTLSNNLYIGPQDAQFIAADFLDFAIREIMDPRSATDLKTILDDTVKHVATFVNESLVDAAAAKYPGSEFRHGSYYSDKILFLRQPNLQNSKTIQEVDADRRDMDRKYNWNGIFRGESRLETAEEIMRAKMTVVGNVDKYEPVNFRANTRILQTQARHETLPENADEEDLVMKLYGTQSPDAVPFIPGYILVSESPHNNRYGFAVDPNGDPYFPCEVTIAPDRKITLAETYQAIGLDALAAKVLDTTDITVDQLAKLIESESIYYVPREYARGWDEALVSPVTYLDDFEEFAKCVQGGKLNVQCTGAAHFLKYSLESLFGAGCAGVVGGNIVSGHSSRITNAGHAQTLYTHEGRQYILDTTPPWREQEDYDDFAPNGDYVRDHKAAQAPRYELADQATAYEQVTQSSKTPEQLASELLVSVTERLCVAFEQHNKESLYDYMVTLPRHDPARSTLELLLRFNEKSITEDEMQQMTAYIKSCAEADIAIRQKLGFDHYSVDFLEQLRSTARYIEYIIKN